MDQRPLSLPQRWRLVLNTSRENMISKLISWYAKTDASLYPTLNGNIFISMGLCLFLFLFLNQVKSSETFIVVICLFLIGVLFWFLGLAASKFKISFKQELFDFGLLLLHLLLFFGIFYIAWYATKIWPKSIVLDKPIGLITLREVIWMCCSAFLFLISIALIAADVFLIIIANKELQLRKKKRISDNKDVMILRSLILEK
jgi:hypothetical protein